MNELQDELPGGIIQAIGTLPTLNASGNLDPAWITQTIRTLTANKVLPTLIPPEMPTIPNTPSLPVPPPPSPPPAPRRRAPPSAPSTSGCENETANISCPTGTIESIIVESGSWDKTSCPSGYTGSPVKKTFTLKPPSCVGKKTCSIPINNSTVGEDALPGHRKQWTATPACSGAKWSSYPIPIIWSPARRTSWGRGLDTEGKLPFCPINTDTLGAGSPIDIGLWGAMIRRLTNSQTLPDGSMFNACFVDKNSMKFMLQNVDGDNASDRHGVVLDVMAKDGSVTRAAQKDYSAFDTKSEETLEDICGTYGFPISNSTNLRLYNEDECTKSMGGVWKPWAMCYKDNNIVGPDSYSVKCAYLNNPKPDEAAAKYQNALNDYQNALKNISDIKARYNNAVRAFNQRNAELKTSFNSEYCFYDTRLKYAHKTFFTSASLKEVPSNNELVVYKNSIITKLTLKELILKQIASRFFQNDVTTIESFRGSMALSDNDITTEHTGLTNARRKSQLNKRMVAYTLEKNNANQNLLTLFGILNVVAIGIIYGIASS